MNKRNIITLVIAGIVVSSAVVAALLTNPEEILNDFQNFINDPFTWEPPEIEDLGNLHLYITSDIYENESASIVIDEIKQSEPVYEINHIYITINKIEIKQKNSYDLIILIKNPVILDLKSLNESVDLFNVYSIPEGIYSAIQFYYLNDIIVETDSDNLTFVSQGADFFSIPFFTNKNNNTETDLEINRNQETELLLTLQMQVKWQQQSMFPHFYGYLEFEKPVH